MLNFDMAAAKINVAAIELEVVLTLVSEALLMPF
jgi:hypothetical protein